MSATTTARPVRRPAAGPHGRRAEIVTSADQSHRSDGDPAGGALVAIVAAP